MAKTDGYRKDRVYWKNPENEPLPTIPDDFDLDWNTVKGATFTLGGITMPVLNPLTSTDFSQPEEPWFLGAFPMPIPASMVGEYLELVRHWEANIRKYRLEHP
jgi:hypothetical protein